MSLFNWEANFVLIYTAFTIYSQSGTVPSCLRGEEKRREKEEE